MQSRQCVTSILLLQLQMFKSYWTQPDQIFDKIILITINPSTIYVTELMVEVNRTTSMPISVLCHDVDKDLYFVLEFNIYPSLTFQDKFIDMLILSCYLQVMVL